MYLFYVKWIFGSIKTRARGGNINRIKKQSIGAIFFECWGNLIRAIKKYYPLHLATLLLAVFISLDAFKTNPIFNSTALLANLFLVQSWVPKVEFSMSFNGVAWFLSTEIFLTAVSPLIVRIVKDLKNVTIVILLVIITAFEFGMGIFANSLSVGHWFVYIFPPIRVLDFLMGAMAYRLEEEAKFPLKAADISVIVLLIVSAFMLILGINREQNELFSTAVWFPLSFLIIYIFACCDGKSFILKWCFSNRLMQYFGKITFEFYLLHQILMRYLVLILHFFNIANWKIWLVLSFVVSVLASMAVYYIKQYLIKYIDGMGKKSLRPEETAADVPVEAESTAPDDSEE